MVVVAHGSGATGEAWWWSCATEFVGGKPRTATTTTSCPVWQRPRPACVITGLAQLAIRALVASSHTWPTLSVNWPVLGGKRSPPCSNGRALAVWPADSAVATTVLVAFVNSWAHSNNDYATPGIISTMWFSQSWCFMIERRISIAYRYRYRLRATPLPTHSSSARSVPASLAGSRLPWHGSRKDARPFVGLASASG